MKTETKENKKTFVPETENTNRNTYKEKGASKKKKRERN